jgi:3-oxoadipate enol-lactonase
VAERVRLPDGTQLDVRRSGRAVAGQPPVLLMRPLGGSMALWGELGERLEDRGEVIAFDPRGVGRSSDAPAGWSTRAMGVDVRVLLDVLAVERADVLGVSLGGMAAAWLASDAPERVRRLVLVSTLPAARTVSRRALGRALGFARCLACGGLRLERCLVRRVLSEGFAEAHPRRMAAIDRALAVAPSTRRNVVRLALAAARHVEPRHPSRHPTLLVFGELDPIAGEAARARLLADHAGAAVTVVAGAGHDVTLEAPEVLAASVTSFLASST